MVALRFQPISWELWNWDVLHRSPELRQGVWVLISLHQQVIECRLPLGGSIILDQDNFCGSIVTFPPFKSPSSSSCRYPSLLPSLLMQKYSRLLEKLRWLCSFPSTRSVRAGFVLSLLSLSRKWALYSPPTTSSHSQAFFPRYFLLISSTSSKTCSKV